MLCLPVRKWTSISACIHHVAVTRLTVPQIHALKLAAKLVDPDLLTHGQQRTLEGAVEILVELIAERHISSVRDRRLAELRRNTLTIEDDVVGEMTIEKLAEAWIAEAIAEERIKPQTVDRYLLVIRNAIVPVLGQLRICDMSVGLLDRFLKNLIKVQVSQTRSAKVVLNQMLGMAVRHGALATNPIRDVGRLRKPRKTVQVLTLGELERIRAAIRQRQKDRRSVSGPNVNANLADIVDLMLATGARIGEILALRWQDIDLTKGKLTICGTLIFIKKLGWSRQDWPKSESGHRTIFLPRFAIELLLRRRPSVQGNDLDAVFVSRNGTWLQPDNVRRDWRKVRKDVGLDWVTPHVFRKTVATLLNEEGRGPEATAQLGHSTEDVTKTYYIAKPATAPDVSDILERLGPAKSG